MSDKALVEAISAEGVGLERDFRAETFQVLQNINISIRQGNSHLLLGSFGSGKHNLAVYFSRSVTPNRGSVSLLGQDITQMPKAQLAQ